MRDLNECYTYIQHLVAEHRRLNAMLGRAVAVIESRYEPNRHFSSTAMVGCLRDIRLELQVHFAEEDDGGCLDEAVSRCPRLATNAGRIQAEHPQLLAEVDGLISRTLECSGGAAVQQAIAKDFSALNRLLHAHEAAEDALLSEAFGSNLVDDCDCQQPVLVGENR